MTEVEELVGFLGKETRGDLRVAALDSVLKLSGSDASEAMFVAQGGLLTKALVRLTRELPWSAEVRAALFTLINASSWPAVAELIVGDAECRGFVLGQLKPETEQGVLAAKVVSNLTKERRLAEAVLEAVDGRRLVADAAERLTALSPEADEAEHPYAIYAGYVLRNLSQIPAVRAQLVGEGLLGRFLPLTSFAGQSKRKLMAMEVLRNVAFDGSLHGALLGTEEVVVAVLGPLAGGEELSEEENEALPLDLQYLEPSKEREAETRLRRLLLETVYQLCSSAEGRRALRAWGVYALLRGTEAAETDDDCRHLCRNVIGVLIRSEDDMGEDLPEDLKALHGPGLASAAQDPSASVIRTDEIPQTGLLRMS